MSRLVVFTFESSTDARQARSALKKLEKRGSLSMDDALVVVREAAGQIKRQRDLSTATLIGAIVGGLMGVPLVFMFTPVSILFGAAAGAAMGMLATGPRVDEEFVDSAAGALQPGNSALLVLLRRGDIAEMDAVLRGLPIIIRQATLTLDAGATPRQALK